MIKVKNIAEAQIGDFINYNKRLSVICAITTNGETYVIHLDDKSVIEERSSNHAEIFRMIDIP